MKSETEADSWGGILTVPGFDNLFRFGFFEQITINASLYLLSGNIPNEYSLSSLFVFSLPSLAFVF